MTPENAPATKADLQTLRQEMREGLESLHEHMRDMQTTVLKASLPLQEQSLTRYLALERRNAALEARMNAAEIRLAAIEKRLLLNPPTA